MHPVNRVPVLVVGADPLARGGLAVLLASRDEIFVAGEAGPDEAAARAAVLRPGALLWDLGLDGSGAEALGSVAPPVGSVVALAASAADAAEAWRAGVRSVLLRGAGPDAIAAGLVAAAVGLAVIDGDLAPGFLRAPAPAGEGEGLTHREREVLALLAEGLGNKAIAARLGVSEHTAKFHVNAILGKLGAESRAEAIVRAARMGLVVL